MGNEPVSPLYPSIGGERCYSFFISVHPCFLVYSSIGYGYGKEILSKEGHSIRKLMNWLYTCRGLISKQPLPIHIATLITTLLCSPYYQPIDGNLFTHLFPNVMASVTFFVDMLITVVSIFCIWHHLLQTDDMHDTLKPWEENQAKSRLCFVLAINVTLRTEPI